MTAWLSWLWRIGRFLRRLLGRRRSEYLSTYDRRLLERGKAMLVFDAFGFPRALPDRELKTIKFRRYSQLEEPQMDVTESLLLTEVLASWALKMDELRRRVAALSVQENVDYLHQLEIDLEALNKAIIRVNNGIAMERHRVIQEKETHPF